MISAILAAAAPAPVLASPQWPPAAMDFDVSCRLFSPERRQSIVRGRFIHTYGQLYSVAFSSSSQELPLPKAGEAPIIDYQDFWLNFVNDGVRYSWHFQLSRESGPRRGTVEVGTGKMTGRSLPRAMDYDAVGICDVTATKAKIP